MMVSVDATVSEEGKARFWEALDARIDRTWKLSRRPELRRLCQGVTQEAKHYG